MSIRIKGDRPIKTLAGLATRPTPSKVRSAVFNIWQWRIAGARWLDLCTGSGVMSAEALSRGASLVVGIEQSVEACNLIHQNLKAITCGMRTAARNNQTFEIHCGDVVSTIPKLLPAQFDLIYFDPPYQSNLYEPVLNAIAPLMSIGSAIAVEHDRTKILADTFSGLTKCDRRQYGQTALSFYKI
jgi:16S rRNA (guanine966-N2)-methyltransferase